MRLLIVPLFCLATGTGCEKRLDASSTSASVPATSSAVSPPVTWHLSVVPTSSTHVDMATAGQHIVGDTTAAMGSLDVTPSDLAKSRGAVMIDLASFATHTFGNADDAKQTKEASAWLEASGSGDTSLRWASFAIRSIDGIANGNLAAVPAAKDGNDDVRVVTMSLHGDLLIHGHKQQRDVTVDVVFRHAAGATAESRPVRVDVTSKSPLAISLHDIDVQPRDATSGKVVAWIAKWKNDVAPSADVTLKLSATPTS